MIEDIYLSPAYWLSLVLLVGVTAALTRSRPLSFAFVLLVFASQYVCHAFMAFGAASEITWFSIGFLALLVPALAPDLLLHPIRWLRGGPSAIDRRWVPGPKVSAFAQSQAGTWIIISKVYLLLFGIIRLTTYPWLGGELDLVARLDASTDNRVGFILGLAILPPIAAVATQWLRRGYRLGILDYLVIVLAGGAIVVAGSKATLLPALLAVVGAAYLTPRPLRRPLFFGALAIAGSLIVLAGYWVSVAADGLLGALTNVAYRVAANTDSLEYLLALGVRPQDFPFAGPGAVVPTLLKAFGGRYDYSPGVWLHGERFGQWQGFGPNPGPLLDYFGNLGWWGLLFAVLIGALCFLAVRVGGALGSSFAATCYFALVDVTLFEAAFGVWFAVLAVVVGFRLISRRSVVVERAMTNARSTWDRVPVWIRGGSRQAV